MRLPYLRDAAPEVLATARRCDEARAAKDWGEADRLRRSMAAWKRTGGLELYEQKIKDGMRQNGYRPEFADAIYRHRGFLRELDPDVALIQEAPRLLGSRRANRRLAGRSGLRGFWILVTAYLTWYAVRFALGAGWTALAASPAMA